MTIHFSSGHAQWFWGFVLLSVLIACAPQPPRSSPGHLGNTPVIHSPPPKDDIPPTIQQLPFVPPPQSIPPLETYTVVVNELPVGQLLFALGRDAGLDIDIYPGISGNVTLNAINKTLPQILERIAKQISLRYQIDGNHITIAPDLPYLRTYKIGYVNMSRDSKGEVSVATQISTTGGGISQQGGEGEGSGGAGKNNNSTTSITNISNHRFWQTLAANIMAILGHAAPSSGKESNLSTSEVIINTESGLITVRATHKQHEEIQKYIDQVLDSAQRQVLIEASVVEVTLNDQYQAGVDWERIAGDFSYAQTLIGGNLGGGLGNPPFYSFIYNNPDSRFGKVTATLRLLEQFGTVKVLSSPKIMTLNNQTAILKVVDNIVYFTTSVENKDTDKISRETYTTTINTVPIGLVMSVTPQIDENEVVTLNMRPTISRVKRFIPDPNPVLARAGTTSNIPEIQVREMESILRINNGDMAIIGGLMQDNINQQKAGVPVLSELPMVGDLFSYRDDQYSKSELVIFLKPVVVKDASLSGDLKDFKAYLPNSVNGIPPTGFTQP